MSKHKDLKTLKQILNKYLNIYSPSHKYYPKNIKALYEGLVEKDLIEAPEGKISLPKFKKAFAKAAKGTKLALIVTVALDENNLGKYFYDATPESKGTKKTKKGTPESFEYGNKSRPRGEEITKVFMVGDTFMYMGPNNKLNELEYRKYHQLLNTISSAIADKEALIQAKDFLTEVRMLSKEQARIDKALHLYNLVVSGIISKYDTTAGFTIKTEPEKIEKELEKLIKDKKITSSKYLTIKTDLNKRLNIKDITQEAQLRNLVSQLEAKQQIVATPLLERQEEMVNVVEDLAETINLRQQLEKLLALLDEKRHSIQDHFDIFEVWSAGEDDGAFEEPELIDEYGEKDVYGNKREGLATKDFKGFLKNLALWSNVLDLYKDVTIDDRLKENIINLKAEIDNIHNNFWKTQTHENNEYRTDVPAEEGNFKRGTPVNAGHIINIHQTHQKADAILQNIKEGITKAMNLCGKSLRSASAFIEFNENKIKEAKQTKRTVVTDTIRLQRAERRLLKNAVKQQIISKEEYLQREERQKRILKSLRSTKLATKSSHKAKSKRPEAKTIVETTFRGMGERKLTRADFATRKEYLEYLKKYDPELYKIESLYAKD